MRFHLLLLIAYSSTIAWAQPAKLTVELVPIEALQERLQDFPLKNQERQERARLLFERSNCPQIEVVPVAKKEVPGNVVCLVNGEIDRWILVGAHFDKVKAGEGKIDNASGTVLLSALMRALAGKPRRHGMIFVAFADEEVGLYGSAALAKKGFGGKPGKAWIENLSAMVNIDSVGMAAPAVALSYSDKELAETAFQMAETLGIEFRAVNVDQLGQSDGSTFAKKKVRTIEFHSLDNTNLQILHSDRDNMKAFSARHYADTYRLLAFYLARLDQLLDQ